MPLTWVANCPAEWDSSCHLPEAEWLAWRSGFIIGEPMPTQDYSAECLKDRGLVGLYRPESPRLLARAELAALVEGRGGPDPVGEGVDLPGSWRAAIPGEPAAVAALVERLSRDEPGTLARIVRGEVHPSAVRILLERLAPGPGGEG